MPNYDGLDDDYVARLLAEDAKQFSKSASGLSTKRRAADAPKPNTRFLTHIVREADHHNATLKQKEEREARRRLQALRDPEPPRNKRKADESDSSRRKRMLGDILGTVRSRSDDKVGRRSRSDRDVLQRDRSRSPKKTSKHERRKRSESPDRSRKVTDRQEREDRHVVKRGRGAGKQGEDRFAKDYDPSQDIDIDPDDAEGQDWDMALEAMRDRAKYRKSQASRMREAGFSEKDISKFESSLLAKKHEADPDLESVKWSKRGETREWDAGKEVDLS